MASRCFGKLVAEVMREANFEAVTSVPNTYHHPQRDTDTVVHGDDFVAVAEDGHLDHFEQVLQNSIENKRVGRIGPRIIVRQHLTVRKQMGLLKERYAELISAVLLQSGLDEKWWADSMKCFCYLRNIQDLLSDGKTPHERRFGEPF